MRTLTLAIGLLCLTSMSRAADYSIEATKSAPDGLSKAVAGLLNPAGVKVSGPDGVLCELWLLKEIAVQPDFSATLNVHYPLAPGQLVGAMRVPDGVTYHDFRGQEIGAGVYTLRYGRQPEDGNHIGTSDLYDFLLALPAKIDQGGDPITAFEQLSQQSAQSAGSTHPAIFSLLPQEEVKQSGVLKHDEDRDYWIVDVIGAGKAGDKSVKVPMRIVTVGRSEI